MNSNTNIDKYQVCIWWSDEDEAFLASMPELPGCMADGTTQCDALINLREVAALWIETAHQLGRQIPAPSPFHIDAYADKVPA